MIRTGRLAVFLVSLAILLAPAATAQQRPNCNGLNPPESGVCFVDNEQIIALDLISSDDDGDLVLARGVGFSFDDFFRFGPGGRAFAHVQTRSVTLRVFPGTGGFLQGNGRIHISAATDLDLNVTCPAMLSLSGTVENDSMSFKVTNVFVSNPEQGGSCDIVMNDITIVPQRPRMQRPLLDSDLSESQRRSELSNP